MPPVYRGYVMRVASKRVFVCKGFAMKRCAQLDLFGVSVRKCGRCGRPFAFSIEVRGRPLAFCRASSRVGRFIVCRGPGSFVRCSRPAPARGRW
jgi:hypothetical protein